MITTSLLSCERAVGAGEGPAIQELNGDADAEGAGQGGPAGECVGGMQRSSALELRTHQQDGKALRPGFGAGDGLGDQGRQPRAKRARRKFHRVAVAPARAAKVSLQFIRLTRASGAHQIRASSGHPLGEGGAERLLAHVV